MTWEEMLQKHEKELAAFDELKRKEWEQIRNQGSPPDQVRQFNNRYNEDYKNLVANTYKEATATLEKEQQEKAHLKYLQEQAKKYPEVDYWKDRIDQIQQEKRQEKQAQIAATFKKGKEDQDQGLG